MPVQNALELLNFHLGNTPDRKTHSLLNEFQSDSVSCLVRSGVNPGRSNLKPAPLPTSSFPLILRHKLQAVRSQTNLCVPNENRGHGQYGLTRELNKPF